MLVETFFPVLRHLQICDCPNLKHSPVISSIIEFEIERISEVSIRLVQNFTSIKRLEIKLSSKLTRLPDELLQNHTLLEVLHFNGPNNLMSLGNLLDKLYALKELNLDGCEQLESLPDGLCSLNSLEMININNCGIKSFPPVAGFSDLSSLRRLSFNNCGELVISDRVRNLTGLEDFSICGCPKMNSLPDGIRNLTALRALRIDGFEGLSSLPNWIGNLRCLAKLKIWDCRNLSCLPEEKRQLKMLRELEIGRSPDLVRRCNRDSGEDWPKIAH